MKFAMALLMLIWVFHPAYAQIQTDPFAEPEDQEEIIELGSPAACSGFYLALATSTGSEAGLRYKSVAQNYWDSETATSGDKVDVAKTYLAFRLDLKERGPLSEDRLAAYIAQCEAIPSKTSN